MRKGLKAASCSPGSCILVVSPIRLFQSFLVKMIIVEQLIDIAQRAKLTLAANFSDLSTTP